jgi:hypothetical protein
MAWPHRASADHVAAPLGLNSASSTDFPAPSISPVPLALTMPDRPRLRYRLSQVVEPIFPRS